MSKPNAAAAKRKISGLDDERAGNSFKESFDASMRKIGAKMSATEINKTERFDGRKLRVAVRVYEYAGDVTKNQFFDKKAKRVMPGAEKVVVALEGYEPAEFKFAGCYDISSNEFEILYEQV
jgi:hypothetical protein